MNIQTETRTPDLNIGARALARFDVGYSSDVRTALKNRTLKRRERRAPLLAHVMHIAGLH